MKFPTYKEMGEKVAEQALDEYVINGKTLREWIKLLSEQEPYICDTCKHKEDSWDTEPCDGCCGNHSGYEPTDAISRDAVWGIIMRSDFVDRFTYQEFTKKLDALPSVPQKSGKWIDINGIYAECSNCNEEIYITGDFKFCPNCGCRMVEPQERNEKINCKVTKCDNCTNHNYCDYEPQERSEKE